jgi:Tol biopolymer transport system component
MTLRGFVLVAAIAASASFSSAAAAAELSFIKFEEPYDPTPTLYVSDADGGNAREVPNTEGAGRSSLSPDGRRVVFERHHGGNLTILWVANVDGSDPLPLAFGGFNPDWSPDGREIVFQGGFPSDIWAVSADGSDRRIIAAGGGHDYWPTWSPDGQDIAFTSNTSLGSEIVRVSAADGSNRRLVIDTPYDPEAFVLGAHAPRYSPYGSRIAFTGYHGIAGSNIFTVGVDGTGIARITDSDRSDGPATWSPDGTSLAFGRINGGCPEIWDAGSSGGGSSLLIAGCTDFPSFRKASTIRRQSTDQELLARHLPILRYDSHETYSAVSAATLTDNYAGPGRANTLRRRDLSQPPGLLGVKSTILASPGPLPGGSYPTLGLSYLGDPGYSDGSATAEGDFIDEVNTYAQDAQRMSALPQYGNRSYGRVVRAPNGAAAVQYWFFYYHNPKTYVGFGAHEGDWEMIQVDLDSSEEPIHATYSQHRKAERCNWVNTQHTGGRPVVYVAEGSHANYFSSGYHQNGLSFDTADGNGGVASPLVESFSAPGGWTDWRGQWGGSDSSPKGPKAQGGAKWNDPLAWDDVDGCTEEQIQSAARKPRGTSSRYRPPASAPPEPAITATRQGQTALVEYELPPRTGRQRTAWRILVSVDSSGSRYTPLTTRSPVDERKGRVRVRIGRGAGPFRILASTVAKDGSRSRTVRVALRR